jgi:hypothetical protein
MKRITSFTLTILIICGITVTAAAYEYAEDGDFNPDIFAALKLNGRFGEYTLSDIMTKGEFAAVIAGIVTNGAAVGTETLILDETPLKLSGALLSAVKALGYSEYMDKMGGYTAIAGNLGLTAGVKADADGSLTFGAASRLVYNSLTASKFEISTYGENLQYEKTGRTFLDDMRLVKIDGIVVETKYTSVDRALTEKQVKLKYSYNERLSGGKTSRKSNMEDIFLTNSPETASYIGKRIIAFVSGFGENGMNIEFAFPYGNTATKIRHDEFAAFNNETFSFSYRVKDTDRDRSFKISYYAAVLINGIKRTSDIILPNENMFKDFDPRYKQFGYISLIDNNSDGVIDFIFVENYQDYFVSNTAVTQSEIRLDDSFWAKPVYIETSFIGDGVTIVDADGNPFDYRDIAKNDVISLMDGHTENGYLKSGKIVVSRETRQGRISSLSPKTDSDGELEIDGIPYDYVVIDTKKPKNYIPAINDEGKFYLDFFSRVVYKDVRSSFSTQYGLLYKLACESKIDSDMKAKIFTDAGIWAVYGFAKHISVRDETNVYAGDKTSYSRENLKARLLGNQKS